MAYKSSGKGSKGGGPIKKVNFTDAVTKKVK